MVDHHSPLDHRCGKSDEAVVVIHGLWMPAGVMNLLTLRLRRGGWSSFKFAYSSRSATSKQNAVALQEFITSIDAPTVHFVAHSLGGLVVTQLMQDYSAQRPGRVVLLGTPYRGSYVARQLSRHRLGRWLCGLSLQGALLGDGPRWPGGRELGVIAGTKPFGVGWLTPGLPRPHDGTVAVAETVVPEQSDNITLPVTHSGMLFSAAVARQVAFFLSMGRFSR